MPQNPKLKCQILTSKIFVVTQTRISPWIVTSISYASIFSHPNQSIWTIVELLGVIWSTLPISVAILNIGHHAGLGLARVGLLDEALILSINSLKIKYQIMCFSSQSSQNHLKDFRFIMKIHGSIPYSKV